MSTWKVAGASSDADLYFCRQLATRIVDSNPDAKGKVEFENMLEVDFIGYMADMSLKKGGAYITYKYNYFVERDGEFIGELMNLVNIAMTEFGMEDAEIANTMLFEKQAKEETSALIKSRNHQACYLTFKAKEGIGKDDPIEYGEIILELFDDYAPKASENFTLLCTGKNDKSLTYTGCPVHRVVPGGWFQLGDVVDGSGKNSVAAVSDEGKFEDESYSIDFGSKFGGIVGYSTSDKHSNGSQFFITLGPCEWMNNTCVGFARVVAGFKTLEAISKVPTTNERPTMPVIVDTSGTYQAQ